MATEIPDLPRDFLGRQINVGDLVTYPTGGTSCRMVLARVIRIVEREGFPLEELQQYEEDLAAYNAIPYEDRRVQNLRLPYCHWYARDGLRAYSRYNVFVNRLREGEDVPHTVTYIGVADGKEHTVSRGPNVEKSVRLDQLHRIVIVTGFLDEPRLISVTGTIPPVKHV